MTQQWQRIASRLTDVGGIPVARAIPVKERRTIGPWCFLDHIGPTRFAPGAPGMDVGPHPHIALQTFTWMLEGEILHRDSLGSKQVIRPGQVNLMTAGRGIAHTEESVPNQPDLHAAQLWIALPEADQHTPPRFDHYPTLPAGSKGRSPSLCSSASTAASAPPPCTSPPFWGWICTPPREARSPFPWIPPSSTASFPSRGRPSSQGRPWPRSSCSTCPPATGRWR